MAEQQKKVAAGTERITLDQLISEASGSVFRLAREEKLGNLKWPPRIWVGIWIDVDQLDQPGQGSVPGR